MDMEEVLLLSSMKWVASLVYPCYSFLGLVGVTSQFSSRAWSDVGFLGNLPSGGCCPEPSLRAQISQSEVFILTF